MSLYAKIEENIVTNLIVCDDSDIITQKGLHIKVTELTGDAVLGGEYDKNNSKFIHPKPFDSWVLDENFNWVSPIGASPEGMHLWNEENQEWVQVIPASE